LHCEQRKALEAKVAEANQSIVAVEEKKKKVEDIVKKSVMYADKPCGCKTKCQYGGCGCKKAKASCSERCGCKCEDCLNLFTYSADEDGINQLTKLQEQKLKEGKLALVSKIAKAREE